MLRWCAITLASMLGGCVTTKMPSRSFAEALPLATAEQTEVAEQLRRHVSMLADEIGPRSLGSERPQLDATANYIEGELRRLGYAVESQVYDVGGEQVKNLEADLRGSTRPDDLLIVGAHYDSVPGCPAANDNGSGVAALLELARLLRDAKPASTIRFVAFVNEEPPHFQTDAMGSRVYARRCKQRGECVVGMISLETMGYYSDAAGSQQYPAPFSAFFPSRGNFISFVGNDRSSTWVQDCVGAFRRLASFPSEGIAAPDHITGIGFSDHWSFWQEGYPALMVTDTALFRYPHYHRPSDTPEKLDYDRTSRVVAGLARVLDELASGAAH